MKKISIFKKLTLVTCALLAVCSGVIAMTGAYFSASASVSGTISMGTIKVHFYNQAGSTNVDSSTTALKKEGLLPGAAIMTPLKIKATSTELNTPAYLRLTMFVPATAYSNFTISSISTLPGSGWVLINSSNATTTTPDDITISSKAYKRLTWYYASGTTLTSVPASTINEGMSVFATTSNMILSTAVESAIDTFTITLWIDAIQATTTHNTPGTFKTVVGARQSL